MNKSIHELIGSNRKKSITKSMFVSKSNFETDFTNTRIEIEAYDETFLNAERNKGEDYIMDMALKQLNDPKVIEAIEGHLNEEINNVRVSYYSDMGNQETVFIQKDNKFMWQSEAYGY